MRVRVLRAITWQDAGRERWVHAGEVIELPDAVGAALVARRGATEVEASATTVRIGPTGAGGPHRPARGW